MLSRSWTSLKSHCCISENFADDLAPGSRGILYPRKASHFTIIQATDVNW